MSLINNFPIKSYLSNPKLKREGQIINMTQHQVEEFIKCADDPIYFIEHYMKVVTLDRGLVQIKLYDYQRDVVNACHLDRKVVMKYPRQSGKCHDKSTKYRLRNKKTGIVVEMTAEQFHVYQSICRLVEELKNEEIK